ncbi:MAG: chemotaxis protein CheR [Desulfobacteraceae bacterium]|nr:MAG: chemotaxis protein CheR [Desulfobacteraceae bacterium]
MESMNKTNEKTINDELLHRFQDLISRHTGLRMRKENLDALRKSILGRMKSLKIDEAERYYHLLAGVGTGRPAEWQELIKVITTGESYFFRDQEQSSLLRNRILPDLIKKNKDRRSLRIWSAGCSSGEEPYSMAILLSQILPYIENWDILILGTDINQEAIRKAKQGKYRHWSFRTTHPDVKNRYFKKHHDEWLIDETIQNRVTFQIHNLKQDHFPDPHSGIREIDLIICRNVFIYFNPEDISDVLKKFTDTLNEGGYLLTGHGELHAQDLGKLRTLPFPESLIYQKISEIKFQISDIAPAKIGLSRAVKSPAPQKKQPKKPDIPSSQLLKKDSKSHTNGLGIEELFLNGRYAEAASSAECLLTDSPDDFAAHYLAAQAYANSGDYSNAALHCKRAIEIDVVAERPYFLMAHISEIIGDKDQAKILLKKATYLNPEFIAAYIELGTLYDMEGDTVRGVKLRTAAVELLKGLPPETIIEPYKKITAGELLSSISK